MAAMAVEAPAPEPVAAAALVAPTLASSDNSIADSAKGSAESTAISVEQVVEAESVQSDLETLSPATLTATAKELPTTATEAPEDSQTLASQTLPFGIGDETGSPGTAGAAGIPGTAGVGGELTAPEPQTEVVKQAVEPTPRPVPSVPEPTIRPEPVDTSPIEPTIDDGLSLPLRQLEVAAGALVVVLALATLWITRRSRRFI
jgi:hypothetical protein